MIEMVSLSVSGVSVLLAAILCAFVPMSRQPGCIVQVILVEQGTCDRGDSVQAEDIVRRQRLKARLAQISPLDWATFILAVGATSVA